MARTHNNGVKDGHRSNSGQRKNEVDSDDTSSVPSWAPESKYGIGQTVYVNVEFSRSGTINRATITDMMFVEEGKNKWVYNLQFFGYNSEWDEWICEEVLYKDNENMKQLNNYLSLR